MFAFEYGIHCRHDDEESLVKNVNAFLAEHGYRKMYRSVPRGLRNPQQPGKEPVTPITTASSSKSIPAGILISIQTSTWKERRGSRSASRLAGHFTQARISQSRTPQLTTQAWTASFQPWSPALVLQPSSWIRTGKAITDCDPRRFAGNLLSPGRAQRTLIPSPYRRTNTP